MTHLRFIPLGMLMAASLMVAPAPAPAAGGGGLGGAFGVARPSIDQIPGYRTEEAASPRRGRQLVIGADHRPVNRWWSPGRAIQAGVAVAVVAATSAPFWGQPAPGDGYCWYYTNAGQSEGFWDACPRKRR